MIATVKLVEGERKDLSLRMLTNYKQHECKQRSDSDKIDVSKCVYTYQWARTHLCCLENESIIDSTLWWNESVSVWTVTVLGCSLFCLCFSLLLSSSSSSSSSMYGTVCLSVCLSLSFHWWMMITLVFRLLRRRNGIEWIAQSQNGFMPAKNMYTRIVEIIYGRHKK